MARGHGPAVYEYGMSWFMRCLSVADVAETDKCKRRRLYRAGVMADIRVAIYGDTETFKKHLTTLTGE